MTPTGSEQPQIPPGNPHISSTGGTESGTPDIGRAQDAGLARLMKAWPHLPTAVKDSILLLVAASSGPADREWWR